MRSNHETEFEAAERRIASLRPCAAAKLAGMEQSFHSLLESVGEDPERQGLRRTPNRAARAFDFLTAGYRQSLDVLVNDAIFDSEASEIVLVKDIELYSMCEHHLLPFVGTTLFAARNGCPAVPWGVWSTSSPSCTS